LVVVPGDVLEALADHARTEDPNEACGLVVFRDGVALRYEPGTNALASPYRFELKPADPATLFLEDDGFELGLFHSHLSAPARPSKTDVENAREDWPDRPFLIYALASDELAAFRISPEGRVEAVPLATS
jgi:[CysO sulfur-carrier protein]-S-L-cysteine hydrolase